jgi:hypothetical protein
MMVGAWGALTALTILTDVTCRMPQLQLFTECRTEVHAERKFSFTDMLLPNPIEVFDSSTPP